MNRYARQEILSEIGVDGQKRLADARVLVVGAGGLACPALQYLVGAGVGWIDIIDHDVVSLSNLHRQTLYREDQVGSSKSQMAVLALSKLNTDCRLRAITSALSPANVDGLVREADIVLDCADSFAVSYILSDACLAEEKPLISASALEFSGYVGGFCGGKPSLRAVFPDLPSRAATCATAGVLGSVVGTIGAMQAQMTLALIVGLDPSPLGQLVTVDLKRFRFGGFRFDGAVEPSDNLLKFIGIEDIKTADFVVDLRELDEAPEAITPDALRYLVTDFAKQIPVPEPQQTAILCCRSGLRAWQAARHLQKYWDGEISLITDTTN
ncbi:MAG: thiamine biosynthesis protein ThiF [Hyphomicrobiales bacterium]|nr:MAG: thiamine biosynthesis protein ThiF [Hyphomicrobiales bacterium]